MMVDAVDTNAFDIAADSLVAGRPIIIPTDTVYGFACLAHDEAARQAIFDLKQRPAEQAMAVLVADAEQSSELISADPRSAALAAAFWPGSLTIVASPAPGSSPLLGGPDGAIGVRCPNHPWVRAFAQRVGPVVATSANRHGEEPQIDPRKLTAMFPDCVVVDGGVGGSVASTVVRLWPDDVEVLRAGPVTEDEIAAALKTVG